jgi:hypothetical protein
MRYLENTQLLSQSASLTPRPLSQGEGCPCSTLLIFFGLSTYFTKLLFCPIGFPNSV